jgi:hypothetical protein
MHAAGAELFTLMKGQAEAAARLVARIEAAEREPRSGSEDRVG